MPEAFQNGFESGELDKWCLGRIDDPAYKRGCARLENFNRLRTGGINRRAGYKNVDRILEIRDSEIRILDVSAFGYIRGLDAEGGVEIERRVDTMYGTSESAVKLIPLACGGNKNYLVYLLARSYGYIEFNGYNMKRRVEHSYPASPYVFLDHTFARRAADPDGYFEIREISGFNSSSTKKFAPGEVLKITDASVIEPAEVKIADVIENGLQRIKTVTDIEIIPQMHIEGVTGAFEVTQTADLKKLGGAYFQEKGAGKDLDLTCEAKKDGVNIKLKFTVKSGGSGFVPDIGKNTTLLRIEIENIGTITTMAQVGPNGAVSSVKEYGLQGYPDETENVAVMRWEAPAPLTRQEANITDWYDRAPAVPADVKVWVNEVEGVEYPALGKVYSITFGEEDAYNKGYGNGYIVSGGKGWHVTVETDGVKLCFIKIHHSSLVGGEQCARELRVVAELSGSGANMTIRYIRPVDYWIDDDLALDALPDGEPYDLPDGDKGKTGGVYSHVFGHAKWLPGGTDGVKVLMRPDGTYRSDFSMGHITWVTHEYDEQPYGGTPYFTILEDFGGLWYLKTMFVLRVRKSRFTLEFQSILAYGHNHYPLMSGKGNITYIQSSMHAASGCPKLSANKNKSATPRIQFYNEGQSYIAPYLNPLSNLGGQWVMSATGNGYMNGTIKTTEEREYLVENANAVTGNGAKLSVTTVYFPPLQGESGFGAVKLYVKTGTAGSGYLERDVRAVVLYMGYSKEKQDYLYQVEIAAGGGTDGMLVLRKPDGTAAATGTAVEYTIPASLKTAPPEDGGKALLTGKSKDSAGDETAVTAKTKGVYRNGALEKWVVSLEVPVSPSGDPASQPLYTLNEKVAASWTREDLAYTRDVSVKETEGAKSYLVSLVKRGKYGRDMSGATYYGMEGGRGFDLRVKESKEIRASILFKAGLKEEEKEKLKDGLFEEEKTPPDTGLYLVENDEETFDMPTYWKWDFENKKFTEAEAASYPSRESMVSGLQYCYTGKYLILCGPGITPFTLEIAGNDIVTGGLSCTRDITVELTKDEACGLGVKNTPVDEAVPALFMRAAQYSPTAIAYINGRLWCGGTPDEPGRIYVSRPNRDKGSRVFDFSTYKLFVTVTPEFTPFQAANDMGSNLLGGVSDGALGLALEYMRGAVKTAKVNLGYDKAFIMATPYFTDGAVAEQAAGGSFELSSPSVPKDGEYTAREAALLRNRAALYTGLGKLKVTIPGGYCSVTADCDGFEISGSTGAMFAGLVVSIGPFASEWHLPYTSWGAEGSERAARIASAVAAVVNMTGMSIPASAVAGGSSAAILAAAQATVSAIVKNMLSNISLDLTNGRNDNPAMAEYGASYASLDAIQAKCDYLLAKHRLYEPKQPFIMRRWKAEEKEYSTPDCGFTFRASSGDGAEGINFIADMRGAFFSTDLAETAMPPTVNGEAQSAQTGSFYGSERMQPAKGADALYFVQKGGQGVMRAVYAPNVPVPVIADAQMYNQEILRGRTIMGIRSARTVPVNTWVIMKDGGVAVLTDEGGRVSWSRVTIGDGEILDAGAIPVSGNSAMRLVAVRRDNGIYVGAAADAPGQPGDVFLDLWREYIDETSADGYGSGAVIYDTATREAVRLDKNNLPKGGGGKYIGYPYTSRIRTLPNVSAASLKPSRIPGARMRLLESHLPYIKGYPSGARNRMVNPLWGDSDREMNTPRDGVVPVLVPGNIEQDAAFEVYTDAPEPLSIACMITEEDA
jgi:hypothetical protein